MSKIREKQIAQLKSTIFFPLVLLVVAWVVFFVIITFNATKEGLSIPEALAIEIPIVMAISLLIICFYIPLFKIYFALKSIPEDTVRREKTIRCVKVKFKHTGGHKLNYRRFCAVVLMDENGQNYTYVLEEVQFKDKENCAPFRACQGTNVTLVCYGDTPYVEEIKD